MAQGTENALFFEDLDKEFVASVLQDDKPVVWQASDIVITTNFEIPVPVEQAGSMLRYEFSTTPGDIAFQVYMVADDEDDDELLVESDRVDSHVEPVVGEIKLMKCGYCVLQFDNSYSWVTNKSLTYQIELYSPPLEGIARDLAYKSRLMIQTIAAENHQVFTQCMAAEDRCNALQNEMAETEDKIRALTTRLSQCAELQKAANENFNSLRLRWEANDSKIPGLCIRCLNRELLGTIFQFLVGEGGSKEERRAQHEAALNLMVVSRYWMKVMLCDVLKVSQQSLPPSRTVGSGAALENGGV